MNLSRHILLLPLCVLLLSLSAYAQPGFKVDIEKPAPYQERKLKSEKTGDGKLKGPKRFMQNLTTRFNYYFNANNKFNEVLEKAKEQDRDDYTQLLSYYNYGLDATAADSAQLDSVIYKARTGIANHDLRNEWIDELYLLWANAWHLQQKFDSASLLLQFINYAYAPQYEDGFYKHIGTNADGARELSIVTKEEKKLLRNNTVSRNNAFLWQIRTRIELDDLTGAGSLINTLKRDPAFPVRLQNSLDEVEAYWWYRQQRWDSAAVHLLAALDGDYPKLEKARWRYLAAQLMERAGKGAEAAALYQKVVSSTPDPVMEVYARLNTVRLSREGGEDATDKNLAELLKMARRDKYEDYRDIIYFMAAQMELERGNIAAASELLIKGSKFATGDQSAKNKAFLQIADASWQQKKYLQAAAFYDSVEVENIPEVDGARVNQRKAALQKVVSFSGVVSRQDSLQRIAALPEDERTAYIKALVKKLRKQQGLKEEPAQLSGGSSMTGAAPNTPPPSDLFSPQKGEWYFYNQTAKAQGASQFKSVWGNRPNVDNWRRFAVVNRQQTALNQPDQAMDVLNPNGPTAATDMGAGNDLSVEGLTGRLPLTPEGQQASNDSIQKALFGLGTAYLNDVDDLPTAIATFEELRRRFPDAEKKDEVLFNLYYANNKIGNAPAAAEAKRLLLTNHPDSRFATIVSTGKDPVAKSNVAEPASTKAYENVYNLFIEGRFAEAEKAKQIADSTYKTTFWQPQLLYIESVYYIKQRQDSVAKNVLQTIIRQNSNKGLTAKAQNLMDVLDRRQQIEDELTRLQITLPGEDTAASKPLATLPPVQKDTVAVAKTPETPAVDSAALAKERQKQIADSLAQSNLLAKRLKDSLETARRDSIALAKKQADEALKDSLARKAFADQQLKDSLALAKQLATEAKRDSLARKALADKQKADSLAVAKKLADERRRDSLAQKALADKQKADSLALAKQLAAERKRDSLAQKALANKQRTDSLAAARRDSLAQRTLAAQRLKDSLAQAKTDQEQARKDSLELAQAIAKSARDSAALRKYLDQRLRDSLARITRDSLLLVKKAADEAKRDSTARQALAAQQRRDSLAAAKKLADDARRDSLARKALADQQLKDSVALAKQLATEAKRDSLARKALADKQKADSLALAKQLADERRRDSLARKARADKQKADSLALAKQLAAERKRDSLAQKALANKQRTDSLAAARRDSLAQRTLAAQRLKDSLAQAKTDQEQARKDSLTQAQARLQQQRDSIALAQQQQAPEKAPPVVKKEADTDPNVYFFNPDVAHYGLVILDKVDPIFVGEARNAFLRYNREQYYGQPLDVQIVNISADTRILVISGLSDAAAATEYVSKAGSLAATEIIPWLTGNKYTFSIISARNLELLKTKGDVPAYKRFLEQHLPGKF